MVRRPTLRNRIAELVDTDGFPATGATLVRCPELLTEGADEVLTQLIAEARHGNDGRVALLVQIRAFLRRCRADGVEQVFVPRHPAIDPTVVALLKNELERAETAEAAYDETGDPTHLGVAADARRRLLAHPSVESAYPGLRAALTNDAGRVFLLLAKALGDDSDLDAAVAAFCSALELTSQSSGRRSGRLSNYGVALRERFRRTGEPATLDHAIQALDAAVRAAQDRASTATAHTNLSLCLSDRYLFTRDTEDLQRAVNCAELAFESDRSAGAATMLGDVLRLRYESTGDTADLTEARALLEAALDETMPSCADHPRRTVDLGIALLDTHAVSGKPDDITRAVSLFESAVDAFPRTSPDRPSALAHLALAHLRNYWVHGDLDDLNQAVAGLSEAVGASLASDRAAWTNNLATALGESSLWRATSAEAAQDLSEAVGQLEGALGSSIGQTDRLILSGSLGGVLHHRYRVCRDSADLDRAIHALQATLDPVREASTPTAAYLLANLGSAYLDRFGLHGRRDDLNQAHRCLVDAVDATEPQDVDRPRRLFALASVLRSQFDITADPEDLANATSAFDEGCKLGIPIDPANTLEVGQEWGGWALSHQRWSEAAVAFDAAGQALQDVVRRQLTREHKQAWLKDATALGTHAMFARLMLHAPEAAVVGLEVGRAVILSETLDLQHAALEEIARDHPDLVERFRQSSARLERSERQRRMAIPGVSTTDVTGGQPTTAAHRVTSGRQVSGGRMNQDLDLADVRRAREQLNSTIEDIREAGHQGFLAAPTFDDIAAAASAQPLIYLAVAEPGGMALVVRGSEVESVALDSLTSKSLQREVSRHLAVYLQYTRDSTAQKDRWLASLDTVTSWLWDVVMGPIMDRVGKPPAIALVAGGLLGLLPLHAAWTPDNTKPTGRRYVLDTCPVRYVPNARSLTAALAVASRVQPERLLAIAEPWPVNASRLPFAHCEATAAAATFLHGDAVTLRGSEATAQMFERHVKRAHVLHFGCHGVAELASPLDSGLLLVDGRYTLRQLLELRVEVRLAVLSACETALPGTDLPDEVIGLPAGLLQAGVAGVIASQWSVPDRATALLMTQFYRHWRTEQRDPAVALRAAQLWQRDSTNQEKIDELENAVRQHESWLPPTIADDLLEDLYFNEPDSRDHKDLHSWAAFAHFGA